MGKGQTLDSRHTLWEFSKWSDDMNLRLLTTLIYKGRHGNRVDGSWTTQAYINIVEALRQSSYTIVTKNSIKNTHKCLTDRWCKVHNLFSWLSSSTWSDDMRGFKAGVKIWNDLIQV